MHHMYFFYTTESRRSSIDIFLKAAEYLDYAVRHVLPQMPPELRFIDKRFSFEV